MRYLRLSEEEKTELELLRKNSPNSVVRERSFMLLLSNNGMCVNEIALLFNHTRNLKLVLEILWKHINYYLLPFDAFINFQNLKERLSQTLNLIGEKWMINYN